MIRVLLRLALFLVLMTVPPLGAAGLTLDKLESRPREMLQTALQFSDRSWDEAAGLLRSTAPGETKVHRIRESSWYALGLLIRDQPGDQVRAVRLLEGVLAAQFNAPGQPWDGTFRRSPEEPLPGFGAELWKNYDPNWRQFVGTTLALILIEFENRLPAGLPARLQDSIRRAVEGELTQGRAEPYHTNIMLMHGFLWSWAGVRLGRADWVSGGEQWAEKVAAGFALNETFDEYNSPTYYGVDLYGLALWRKHGATEKIRTLGAQMEAGLWRDIGRFYHAGLKNMCGPFDRAYGMDMRRYVSLTGSWMGLVLPADLTPLPDPAGPMEHAHDFAAVSTYVALGANVPDEVLAGFRAFKGERVLRRPITTSRTATAWLAHSVMIGGEITHHTVGANPTSGQFHPATIHWRVPGGEVGWVRLYASPPCDAEAGKETLTITVAAAGDFVFRISAPGLTVAPISREHWLLPGLNILVETDAGAFTVSAGEGFIEVRYASVTRIVFRTIVRPAGVAWVEPAGQLTDLLATVGEHRIFFPVEFSAEVASHGGGLVTTQPLHPR